MRQRKNETWKATALSIVAGSVIMTSLTAYGLAPAVETPIIVETSDESVAACDESTDAPKAKNDIAGTEVANSNGEQTADVNRICEAVPLSTELQKTIRELCTEYDVPYEMVLAVIEQESCFEADADNGSCVGYMQINRINSQWLNEEIGVTDLNNSEQNVTAGIWMLGRLFGKYEDWNMALTAYNHGESGAERKYFSKGQTSCEYSKKVQTNYEKWVQVLEAAR